MLKSMTEVGFQGLVRAVAYPAGLNFLLAAVLLSAAAPELANAQAAKVPAPMHYTIIDRGPSLVRTLINTPGLNLHGDLAIWRPSNASVANASMLQGVVFRGKESTVIAGEKDFSMVFPADINDRLTVVGSVQIPQDLRFTHAFRWSDNKMEILDALGGKYAAASAVNQAGDTVGSAQTVQGTRHAVLWEATKSTPLDLGLLQQGDYSGARDINDKNEIVGEANTTPNGLPRGFLWRDGKMKLLSNVAGGSFCSAQAVNDRGEIVGSCDLPNGASRAVMWRDEAIAELGTLGDDDAPSTALDINVHGQVVGSSEVVDGKQRAFLWQEGKIYNLNDLVGPKSGWLLLVASRINDNGEIAGRGFYRGAIHAFVLHPDHVLEMKSEVNSPSSP